MPPPRHPLAASATTDDEHDDAAEQQQSGGAKTRSDFANAPASIAHESRVPHRGTRYP